MFIKKQIFEESGQDGEHKKRKFEKMDKRSDCNLH